MRVTVNGKARDLAASGELDLLSFLRAHSIDPRLVAVAINGDVVPRDTYAEAQIRDGDAIEVVRMVGGGR